MKVGVKGLRAPSYSVPTGSVTLWFSDIEGSTQRWDAYRDAMQAALRRHDALMHAVIAEHGGHVFKTIGDAFCAAFQSPSGALAAALGVQRAMGAEDWSAVNGLRVRLALHAGETDERDGDYYGPTVNRVARLLSTAHGGQTILSSAVAELLQGELPPGCSLRDLGRHRLKDLAKGEHVYQLVTPDLRADFPALRSLETLSNNLPLQLTTFVGRASESAKIKALLADSRLVTLLGAGGIGKTRTALHVAADVLERFPDGAWFVDLAPLSDPKLVLSALADVFEVEDVGGRRPLGDLLMAVLKQKHALIILDNCEHVIGAAAAVVGKILEQCPKISLLATSREALNIGAERRYHLPSLGVPQSEEDVTAQTTSEYAAVRLFVDRARSVMPSFRLTDDNAPVVAAIVRDLDGIAFAIELAAARVTVLSVTQLAQRLHQRLRLLTGGSRTASPRQQTLRALIDWSYQLLGDAERMLLRHCSVFRGGWTLDAADEICGSKRGDCDVLTSMTALVEKSLAVFDADSTQNRYGLLESTRQYAAEQLRDADEQDSVAARHCNYFRRMIERHYEIYRKTDWELWLKTARCELENYRAAIDWGLLQGNDIEAGAMIVGCLCPLWMESFRGEGRTLALRARDALGNDVPPRIRGIVLAAIAFLDSQSGASADVASEAVAVLEHDNDWLYGEALFSRGISLIHAGRLSEAAAAFDAVLTLGRRLGLPLLVSGALGATGVCAMHGEDRQHARRLLEDAVELTRAQGNYRGLTVALHNVAELLFAEGDCRGAIDRVRDAIAVDREQHCERSLMFGLVNLAAYELAVGEVSDARRCAREALQIAVRRQQPMQAVWAIGHLAQVAAVGKQWECAARLLAYADAVCGREGTVREATEQCGYDRTVVILRDALAPTVLERLMHPDCALDEGSAISAALAVAEPIAAAGAVDP